MATTHHDYCDLRMIGPRYRSASGTEILSYRVFNGVGLLGINLDKQPKPIFNRHWKYNEVFHIAKYMSDFIKAEPGTDKTLVFNSYNRIEKKIQMDYVYIMRRDENKVFHIIIKTNGQTYDFPIRGPRNIAFGTGDIPEDEKSLTEWMFLINYIKNTMQDQMQMTNWPMEQQPGQGGGYNRGGQGNYNRGGQGGGGNYTPRPNSNGEFQSSRGLPTDDDMFE